MKMEVTLVQTSSVMSVKTLASHWRAKTYSALSFDKIFSNEANFAFDFTFKPLVKYYCFHEPIGKLSFSDGCQVTIIPLVLH